MLRVKTFALCLIICLFCAPDFSAQKIEKGADPAWQKGNSTARFVLELFYDYQCRSCAVYDRKIKELQEKHPADILIIYRHLPLNIPGGAHKNARLAAQATEAAGKQNKFWEMSETILQNQKEWSDSEAPEKLFIEYAAKLGLKTKRFKKDLYSSKVKKRIDRDLERARSLNLNYTPAVLLNGKILPLEQAINLEETLFSKEIN